MGRLLRILFLIDLIRTDDPSEIRAFANDKRLDRNFSEQGSLLNRIVTRKVRTVLALEGIPLPSVSPRGDNDRARSQTELQARLDTAAGDFDRDSITDIARAVRGFKDAPILEHAIQQAVGRVFAKDYRADEESWAAAQLLDKAAHSMNPLAAMLWPITGRITRAQRLLADKVHRDRAGVHATGIAVHNLVRGFVTMRSLFAYPNAPDPAAGDSVVARCLQAPESVLREAAPDSGVGADAIRPGTLVVLDLKAAHEQDAGPEITFMSGSWSQCPAGTWVPALIRTVWERALQLQPPSPQRAEDSFRLEFTRAAARHRRAIYCGILGCNLVLQLCLGIIMLAAPVWFSRSVGAVPSSAADLVRIWGMMLILLVPLYGAGWFDPIYIRWPNAFGIGGRCATSLLYLCLGGGFLWFALFDAAFAAALTWAYSQAIRAELMTRP